MSTIHVLFENESWMPPLRAALEARGLPWVEHVVTGGPLDLAATPPDGVYLNRMSPSAHTRDHQGGVTFLRQALGWLEDSGRRVINGRRAFELETSKVAQDLALRRAGIRTPRTVAVVGGPDVILEAAKTFDGPFLTKHNQGGKGLGVRLFESVAGLDEHLRGADFVQSPDGVLLLQQYIRPARPFITRVEIVGGAFQYAIHSSTEAGFELCPAVDCAPGDAFCPVGDSGRFSLRTDLTADDPLVRAYVRVMRRNGIDVAGIEFVEDENGVRYTYDINGTTNFNADVEAKHGLSGMGAIARLLERELDAIRTAEAA
jgi:glutathione synthase/RimK-type ligase-like ATP-grasp enzyme